jgi:hypothetical protein
VPLSFTLVPSFLGAGAFASTLRENAARPKQGCRHLHGALLGPGWRDWLGDAPLNSNNLRVLSVHEHIATPK